MVNIFKVIKTCPMKRIFTLFLTFLVSIAAYSMEGSRLSISAFGNNQSEFRVEINGRRYEMRGNSLTLSNLRQGNHMIRVYREYQKRPGSFRRQQQVVYSGTVYLRSGFHLDIAINRFGKALVDERRIGDHEDWIEDGSDDYYDGGSGRVMSDAEFSRMKQSISQEWLESNKLNSVQFVIQKNEFTTAQVCELMQLFSFEKNRLEVAKAAYRKTVDKHNYYRVNELLSFNHSKEELARFIRG